MSTSSIDWPALHAEALEIFVRYLRIDTSNPPGNEAAAVAFLRAILDAEGIASETIAIQPGRDALVARLPGDGSQRPLMLCNHTDVVPVEAQFWTKPPFDGLVEDGKIYGRGAVDMKGAAVMQLITLLVLKRQRVPLRRDLVFLAVPDEEAGSVWGMDWLGKHRPEILDVEFELSEGGSGTSRFAGRETQLFSVAVNEKDIYWLRLVATGTPGHGSRPHTDNAAVHLVRALERLAAWDRPLVETPDTRAYLDALRAEELFPRTASPAERDAAIRRNPFLHALFVNTLNITMLDAGIRPNVIPARAEAVIDCRLLPGQTREDWLAQVRAVIDDERVEVEPFGWDQEPPQPVPWDTLLYRTIEEVVGEAVEGAIVAPSLCIGGTDNRFLRARGIPAYGFIPCLLSPEEAAGFHGNDEFLTVENLQMGCELTFEIVRRICT